jgi:hypothetical protein
MERCDLRDLHECWCPGECAAAPPKQIDLTQTPVTPWAARDQFYVVILASVFISICVYGALSRADHVIKIQLLDNQEASVQWTK